MIVVVNVYYATDHKILKQKDNVPFPEPLSEERVVSTQDGRRSGDSLKRVSAMFGTGGVGLTTPPAESPSRDFGSIIFNSGAAGDRPSRRPV